MPFAHTVALQVRFVAPSRTTHTCTDGFTGLTLKYGLAASVPFQPALATSPYVVTPLSLLTLSPENWLTLERQYWDVYSRWATWQPYNITQDQLAAMQVKFDTLDSSARSVALRMGSGNDALTEAHFIYM